MRRVRISVFNNDYYIKTDADEEYVTQIANYLEEKLREASPDLDSIPAPRPFLLATLKIADDYFRLKREFEEFKNRAEERSKSLVDMLDNSFKNTETFSPQVERPGEGRPKE
jgi:cell division protein ZapA